MSRVGLLNPEAAQSPHPPSSFNGMPTSRSFRLLAGAALVAAAAVGAPARVVVAQDVCSPSGSTDLPRVTLPLEVLDYLERTSASPFVEAFLISHMTEGGNQEHWLGQCARKFIDTPAQKVDSLRRRRIPAERMIEVLRAAEEARLADERLRASNAGIRVLSLVEQLRTAADPAALATYGPYLAAAQEDLCRTGAASSHCATLKSASRRVVSLRLAYERLRAEQVAYDRANSEYQSAVADSARLHAEHVSAGEKRDSLQRALDRIATDAVSDTTARRETLQAEIAQTGELIKQREAAQESQIATVSLSRSALRKAEDERRTQLGVLDAARAALQQDLNTLLSNLQDGTQLTTRALSLVARVDTRVSGIVNSPASLVASGGVQSVRSPNILLELTDFIIARARQEMVIGYLTTLYSIGRTTPGVHEAFPGTFRLIQGLAEQGGARLSATAAGRIPIDVWRASLADDYRRIPMNLVRHLCRAGSSCAQQLAMAMPALLAADRVVRGEPIFDVLREVPADIRTHGSAETAAMRDALAHGAGVVVALTDALRIQGIAEAADPLRHPYILSGRALSQLSPRQRDAFVRVLLLRTVPEDTLAIQLDVNRFLASAERALRGAELLATTSSDSGASASRLVRHASTTFLAGFDVALTLLPANHHPALKDVRERWSSVFEVLDPLARGDYSLVMPRTIELVRTVSNGREAAPAQVLTLMGLATSLSTAQSGADVRAAFEAAAAPVGVWQEKRYQQGSPVSIASFPGAMAAWELLEQDGTWADGGVAAGVFMPIGVEVQLRGKTALPSNLRDSRCTIWLFCSAGLYISVIDLGALATYRLSGTEQAEVAPNTTLRQVFAPGAFLTLGLRRTPLALLVGGQLMPGLRSVTDPNGESREVSAIRGSLGITADVTLFRF